MLFFLILPVQARRDDGPDGQLQGEADHLGSAAVADGRERRRHDRRRRHPALCELKLRRGHRHDAARRARLYRLLDRRRQDLQPRHNARQRLLGGEQGRDRALLRLQDDGHCRHGLHHQLRLQRAALRPARHRRHGRRLHLRRAQRADRAHRLGADRDPHPTVHGLGPRARGRDGPVGRPRRQRLPDLARRDHLPRGRRSHVVRHDADGHHRRHHRRYRRRRLHAWRWRHWRLRRRHGAHDRHADQEDRRRHHHRQGGLGRQHVGPQHLAVCGRDGGHDRRPPARRRLCLHGGRRNHLRLKCAGLYLWRCHVAPLVAAAARAHQRAPLVTAGQEHVQRRHEQQYANLGRPAAAAELAEPRARAHLRHALQQHRRRGRRHLPDQHRRRRRGGARQRLHAAAERLLARRLRRRDDGQARLALRSADQVLRQYVRGARLRRPSGSNPSGAVCKWD